MARQDLNPILVLICESCVCVCVVYLVATGLELMCPHLQEGQGLKRLV